MIYLTIALAGCLAALTFTIYRFTKLLEAERKTAMEERAMLLQRIQAPELAVAAKAQADMEEFETPKLHLAYDNDEEWALYEADR